ncbi:MAG: hypothetical protein ACLPXT_14790 [Terracidiphilus sp.]
MQTKPSADLASAREEWQKRFEKDKARLLKNSFFAGCLKNLSDSGADQGMVISLLYYTLPIKRGKRGSSFFKRRAQAFRATARSLEQDASVLADIYSTPLNFAEFWSGMTFPGDRQEVRTSDELKAIPKAMIADMRAFARTLDEEANCFGKCSRLSGLAADNFYVGELLRYVFSATGKYHVDILADLLQFMHGELGSDRAFSSEQLKKVSQRRL